MLNNKKNMLNNKKLTVITITEKLNHKGAPYYNIAFLDENNKRIYKSISSNSSKLFYLYKSAGLPKEGNILDLIGETVFADLAVKTGFDNDQQKKYSFHTVSKFLSKGGE